MSDDGRSPRPPGRREQVYDLLRQATEPTSIVAVARALDIHPNTARFHLEALLASGRLERVLPTRSGPGRPPRLFRVRRGMDPGGPRNYALLAGVLVDGLGTGPEASGRAVEAGRAWGRRLADRLPARGAADPAERLVELLDDLGFAPERRTTGEQTRIGLRHCPFLDLAADHRAVVCPVHLGLMQGAMERIDGDVAVEGLDPFVEPDLCLTRLAPAQPTPAQPTPAQPTPATG